MRRQSIFSIGKGIALSAVMLCLGCDGAYCPYQRPSCCDNALFGCTSSELPQGCSCDDYFSRSFSGMKLQRATPLYTENVYSPALRSKAQRLNALRSVEGTWRVSLTKTSSGCDYLSDKVSRTFLIRERRRKVNVKLLGVTTLSGMRMGGRVRARGSYRTFFPRCSADIKTTISLTDSQNATVTGSLTTQCSQSELSCSVTYQGVAKRL